jgi:hypothetical protein
MADERALIVAIDKVAQERAEFVEKHPERLVKEATRVTDAAHERARAALAEFVSAREELVEGRRAVLWAALYPSVVASREPRWQALAGGLKRVIEKLGIAQVIGMGQVVDALGEDVEWAANAQTPEQRQALQSRPHAEGERVTPRGDNLDPARDQRLADRAHLGRQLRQDERRGRVEDLGRRV